MSLGEEAAHIDVLPGLDGRTTRTSGECIDETTDLTGGMEASCDAPERVARLHDHLDRR